MHNELTHRFIAEVRDLGGGPVLRRALTGIDWDPLAQCARFMHARAGARLNPPLDFMRISPLWDGAGRRVLGLQIASRLAGGVLRCDRVSVSFLSSYANAAVSALVEDGQVKEGASVSWVITADAPEEPDVLSSPPPPLSFRIDEVDSEGGYDLPLRNLSDLKDRATHLGPAAQSASGDDYPVFVSRGIVEQAARAAERAGDLESGAILLGVVARDESSGDLLLEITAQVPVMDEAERESLRIGPRSWRAAQEAIARRGQGEEIVGFIHSHPRHVWACAECNPIQRSQCTKNRPFFSAKDVDVMRTAFPSPLHIAPLLSFQDQHDPVLSIFGWRGGEVAERGIYLI